MKILVPTRRYPLIALKTGIVLAPKWLTIASIVHITRLFLTPTSSSSTATARIVHELRRRLIVSPSASLRRKCVQTNGWIMNFSSSSSSNMDKTTELSYNHLISQLRKENADLRNEVRELRKLLTRKGDKPPN